MINILWHLVALLLARPAVTAWLITRARHTPYLHIKSADGSDTYMGRWWLFNAYDHETREKRLKWFPWSVRIHHIRRPDADRDLHDHPWNARTVILRGRYTEQRLVRADDPALISLLMDAAEQRLPLDKAFQATEFIDRMPGSTATLRFGEYHRIDEVSADGVWTLFITGPYRGTWGFLVDGIKVPWRKYTGVEE